MKKQNAIALLICFGSGMVVSFLCVMIFSLKTSLSKQDIVLDISTLTDTNAMQWAASPGVYNIPITHSFQVFTQSAPGEYDLLPTIYDYTYTYEYKNRSYIPSSPGYLSFIPYVELVPQSKQSNDEQVSQYNLVALQQFYRGASAPLMRSVPQYMYVIMQVSTLQNDFLVQYFTRAVFQFYISEEDVTKATIFAMAALSVEQIDALWSDKQFGWSQQASLGPWVRYALIEQGQYNGIYSELAEYFQLSPKQMDALAGPTSQLNKLIRAVTKSVSDGVYNALSDGCVKNTCTLWELATVQWGEGCLTRLGDQLFPGMTFDDGGYAAMNDSLPVYSAENKETFEYYLGDELSELGVNVALRLTTPDVEGAGTLFNFATMNVVVNQLDNLPRIQSQLILDDLDTSGFISEYVKRLIAWVEQGTSEYLPNQIWRFAGKMMQEGATLLRNGLNAKALFYKKVDCTKIIAAALSKKVCGNPDLDFTLSAKNGLLWVEALAKPQQFQGSAFQALLKATGVDSVVLERALDAANPLATTFATIQASIAKAYGCSNAKFCSERELFLLQWPDCHVTLNLPTNLGFQDEDKVCGIANWGFTTQQNVHYELGSFLKQEKAQLPLSPDQVALLLSYNSGGLLGYYPLNSLTSYLMKGTPLPPAFFLTKDQATLALNYLKSNLVNYQYGGEVIKTDPLSYLFNYENQYTQSLKNLSPLDGGIDWKSNAANLVDRDNSAFTADATKEDSFQIDTGIVNIDNVRNIIKTMGDYRIKSKQIVHKSKSTTQVYYYHPSEQNVTGSEGFGYAPLGSSTTQQHQTFDWILYENSVLNSKGRDNYMDMDCATYTNPAKVSSQFANQQYPLQITQGKVDIRCGVKIKGQDCQAFLNGVNNDIVYIEKVSGYVLSLRQTYVYWLDLGSSDELFYNANGEGLVPLAIRTVNMHYTQQNIDDALNAVQSVSKQHKLYFVLFFVLAGLFTFLLVGGIVYYCKNKQNFEDLGDYRLVEQHQQQQQYSAVVESVP